MVKVEEQMALLSRGADEIIQEGDRRGAAGFPVSLVAPRATASRESRW